jgi:hypothetical protein
MQGDTVIVRAYGNKPLIIMVWNVSADVVFITDDQCLKTLSEGRHAPMPIVFRFEDVFIYDKASLEIVKNISRYNKIDWSLLKPWKPTI